MDSLKILSNLDSLMILSSLDRLKYHSKRYMFKKMHKKMDSHCIQYNDGIYSSD